MSRVKSVVKDARRKDTPDGTRKSSHLRNIEPEERTLDLRKVVKADNQRSMETSKQKGRKRKLDQDSNNNATPSTSKQPKPSTSAGKKENYQTPVQAGSDSGEDEFLHHDDLDSDAELDGVELTVDEGDEFPDPSSSDQSENDLSNDEASNEGSTTDEDEDIKRLEQDPVMKKLLFKMVNKMKQKEVKNSDKGGKQGTKPKIKITSKPKVKKGAACNKAQLAPQGRIKSPSDTTLYVPAVRKAADNGPRVVNANLENEISSILGKMRQACATSDREEPQPSTSREAPRDKAAEPDKTPGRQLAEKTILDAERFRASVQPPPGTNQFLTHNL